jgi:hypothetical protein
MAQRVDAEELETTKSEKLLAFVLASFLLIGGVWAYTQIDDRIRDRMELAAGSETDRAAVERAGAAQNRAFEAERAAAAARRQVEFTREEWRAALDAERPAAALEARYRTAQDRDAAARAEASRARERAAALQPAAREASERIAEERADDLDRQELYVFLARLALVLASLGLGYWLLADLRRRSSRWLPLGAAALLYATVFAFVLTADYLTDFVDPLDYGLLLVSIVGVAATVAAFWSLQRYLARRLPYRRVRKGECPFCGFPVRGTERCEGCGRRVLGECTACGGSRRVGSAHCGLCGAA